MAVPSPTSRRKRRVDVSIWDAFWALASSLLALWLGDDMGFKTSTLISPEHLRRGINDRLPADIHVLTPRVGGGFGGKAGAHAERSTACRPRTHLLVGLRRRVRKLAGGGSRASFFGLRERDGGAVDDPDHVGRAPPRRHGQHGRPALRRVAGALIASVVPIIRCADSTFGDSAQAGRSASHPA